MKRILNHYTILSLIAISLFLAGCEPEEIEGTFPHDIHVESGLTCDICHEFEEVTVSMPELGLCMECHLPDDETFFGDCNSCHQDYGVEMEEDSIIAHKYSVDGAIPQGWEDVRYKHAEFLDVDADCFACHENIETSEAAGLQNYPSMEKAMDVHEEWGLSNECSACHLELNEITAPVSHDSSWERNHGKMAEFQDRSRCLLCHEEKTCSMCHQLQKPRDHTNMFRRKTHGIQASFDRARCLVCHRNDECEACHVSTADPVPPAPYHTEGSSCLSCHSRLASEGPEPRPPKRFFKPMPHTMMMGVTSQKCLQCHRFGG